MRNNPPFLLEHQIASMNKMRLLEVNKQITTPDMILDTSIGILADKSGYGKTRTVVSFIKEDAVPWNIAESHFTYIYHTAMNGLVVKKILTRHKRINLSLVVVDKLILNQWIYEFSLAVNLRVRVIKHETDLKNDITDEAHDVILCTSALYNSLIRDMGNITFKRVVFDDPDNIKITRMKPVMAGFIWLITSNPYNMEKVHKNSKNNFFGDIVKYNKIDKFSNYITLIKIESNINADTLLPEPIEENHECFSPYYITGDITQEVIELISRNRMMDVLNIIGGVYNHAIVSNRDNKKCSICYENITHPVMEPDCQNIFCASCLLMWLKDHKKCPLCRSEIKLNKLVYEIPDSIQRSLLTKEMVIKNIITNNSCESRRIVIYSDKDSSLIPIKNAVSECDMTILEIKGSYSMINSALSRFKTNNGAVIHINSKFYATGLDLKNTTDLILYHKVSPDIYEHLVSRCNRLGREAPPLRVHKLFYIGSD